MVLLECFADGIDSIDVVEETNSISLNSLDIKIGDVTLEYDGKTLKPESQDYLEDVQTVKFTFGEKLQAGKKVVLKLDYVGELNNNMAGTLRYIEDEGKEREWKANMDDV